MSYNVSGTTITLTRGDTFMAQISITDSKGEPYIPVEGDSVRFAMKSAYTDDEPLPANMKLHRKHLLLKFLKRRTRL